MYSREERIKAVGLYIKYGRRPKAVMRELGYPKGKASLKSWHRDYLEEQRTGIVKVRKQRESKYSDEQKRRAVDHYFEYGCCRAYTIRELGYPSSATLVEWIDELEPGRRILRTKSKNDIQYSLEQKKQAVIDLCARGEASAHVVAAEHGLTRAALYVWKSQLLGEGMPVKPDCDESTEEIAALRTEAEDLAEKVYRLRMERDILEETVRLVKKDPAADPAALTNREKTVLITKLRSSYRLSDLLESLEIAKSSYFYQKGALSASDKYDALSIRICELFAENRQCYGYRRIHALLKAEGTPVSEKVVRKIMRQNSLEVKRKRTKRFNAYAGEIGKAPDNVVNRDFHALVPNEIWLTDISEFAIPAGKAYLSPILDCFDGMLTSWSIGTNPDAKLANSSLEAATKTLQEGECPTTHSDRGGHYRWPGWVEIIESNGLTRSMSKKSCPPDNAACEGLFGRIKNEFFYGRDWSSTTMEDFINQLDDYLHWYNEVRIKESLGWMSPLQYRTSLGLAA